MSMDNSTFKKNTLNTISESNQFIALKKIRQFEDAKKKRRKTIHSWIGHWASCSWSLTNPRVCYLSSRRTNMKASASGSKTQKKASVVILLHLRPVRDPVLFSRVPGLTIQVGVIALSPTDFHPLVLWHYPVVDGSPEESQLWGGETEIEAIMRWRKGGVKVIRV